MNKELKKLIEKYELKENEKTSCKFKLKNPFNSEEKEIVNLIFKEGGSERTPLLTIECNDKEGYAGEVYFAIKDLVFDTYDKAAIVDEIDELVSLKCYNSKLFNKTFLNKIKLGE